MPQAAVLNPSALTSAVLSAVIVFGGFVLISLAGQSVFSNQLDVVRAVVISGAVSVAVGVSMYRRSDR